jgi:diacylglycerol kinase family enzyme
LRVEWEGDAAAAGRLPPPPISACWVFGFNLPCYGGGLRIAPQACGSDGLLDLCAFRQGGFWHGLRYAGGVLLGGHQNMADCTIGRVRRLRITSTASVPYQLDGDPAGFLPVDVEVLPRRLTLVVPATRASELNPEP